MSISDKLVTIAENEQKVYEAGYQAQYDLFWDAFQANGTRTSYSYAFAYWYYATNVLKPKYDIKPVGSVSGMFRGSSTYISLPAVCEKQGIVMDFSKVTSFNNFLTDSAIYHIGTVDCSSCTNLTNMFHTASSLVTIDDLIVHEGITTYLDAFALSPLLKNMKITGTIAGNSFDVHWNPNLTHDSLMSIINALKDYSGTSTTKTITLGTTNLAKLTDEEKAIATERGWTLA